MWTIECICISLLFVHILNLTISSFLAELFYSFLVDEGNYLMKQICLRLIQFAIKHFGPFVPALRGPNGEADSLVIDGL